MAAAGLAGAGGAGAEPPAGDDLVAPRPLPMADGVPLPIPLPSPGQGPPGYSVQVGAFRAPESARALAARLVARGYDAFVTTVDLGDGQGTWHRVRVGRLGDRTLADWLAGRLAEAERLPAQVVRDAPARVDTTQPQR